MADTDGKRWISERRLQRFWNGIKSRFTSMHEEVEGVKTFVHEEMADYVTDWLTDHVDPVGSAVVVDDSLSISGAAADAKAAGDAVNELKNAYIPYFLKKPDCYIGNGTIIDSSEYTLTVNKQLKKDGTVIDKDTYNILSLTLDENYIYYLKSRAGSEYAIIRFMQIEDKNGNVIAYYSEDQSGEAERYIRGITGVCKLCYRNYYTYTIRKYDSNAERIESKANAFLQKQKEYTTNITDGSFVSAGNGRIVETTSAYSRTDEIHVEAGDVIHIPATNASDAVSLVAKRLDNPTPLYSSLLTTNETGKKDFYYLIEEACDIIVSIDTDRISQVKIYDSSLKDIYEGIDSVKDAEDRLNPKLHTIIGDEIPYTATTTDHAFISSSNGRITTTTSDYSCTSDISVKAGSVIFVPATNASDAVSLVAKRLDNPTPLYSSLLTTNETGKKDFYYLIEEDCEIAFSINTNKISLFKIYDSAIINVYEEINELKEQIVDISPIMSVPTKGQIAYEGDDRVSSGYICNAVAYEDGVIIAARSSGSIVRIGFDGTEEVLLSLQGSKMDWRCLYMDSNENVYASPHASWGSMQMTDRGLYKLVKGANSMTKVISLYDPNSQVTTEIEENDDTIWTMCEDESGNLYAGVYAHTVRDNPGIYKSTDGGDTWTYIFNFNTEELTTSGSHIHSIIFSKWKKALYCIVGEINTIFKSIDGGTEWTDLNVTLVVKGSAMCPTPYGIFIGSDGAYNCDIDLLYPDDVTHKRVFRGWANTVFAIRRSDLTGFLYAFTKIDSSVNNENYFPPVTVLDGTTTIEEWEASVSSASYNNWLAYHDSVENEYPTDAIRPQHYAILISRNGGESWKPLIRFDCASTGANGLWTTGYFINGECLTGRMEREGATVTIMKPIIVSEGKHKYVSGGCDLSGEILVRTNTSAVVEVI